MPNNFKSSKDILNTATKNLDSDKQILQNNQVEISLIKEQNNSLNQIKRSLSLEEEDQNQLSIAGSLRSSAGYLSSISGRLNSITSTVSAIQSVTSPLTQKIDTTISLLGSIKTGLTQITGVLSAFRADYLMVANGVTPRGESRINKSLIQKEIQEMARIEEDALKKVKINMRKAAIFPDLMSNTVRKVIGNRNLASENDDGKGLIAKLLGKISPDAEEYAPIIMNLAQTIGMFTGNPNLANGIDDRNIKSILGSFMPENTYKKFIKPLDDLMAVWSEDDNGMPFNIKNIIGDFAKKLGFGTEGLPKLEREKDPNLVMSALAPHADDIRDIVTTKYEMLSKRPKIIPIYAKPVWVVNSTYQENGLEKNKSKKLETMEDELLENRLYDLISGRATNRKDIDGRDLLSTNLNKGEVKGEMLDRFFDRFFPDASYDDKVRYVASEMSKHRQKTAIDRSKSTIITQDALGRWQKTEMPTIATALNSIDYDSLDELGQFGSAIASLAKGDILGAVLGFKMADVGRVFSQEGREDIVNKLKSTAGSISSSIKSAHADIKAKEKKLNIPNKFEYIVMKNLKLLYGYDDKKKVSKDDAKAFEMIVTVCFHTIDFDNEDKALDSLVDNKDNLIREFEKADPEKSNQIYQIVENALLECWNFEIPPGKVESFIKNLGVKTLSGLDRFVTSPPTSGSHQSGRKPINNNNNNNNNNSSSSSSTATVGDSGDIKVNEDGSPMIVNNSDTIVPKVHAQSENTSELLNQSASMIGVMGALAENMVRNEENAIRDELGQSTKDTSNKTSVFSKILNGLGISKTKNGKNVLNEINKLTPVKFIRGKLGLSENTEGTDSNGEQDEKDPTKLDELEEKFKNSGLYKKINQYKDIFNEKAKKLDESKNSIKEKLFGVRDKITDKIVGVSDTAKERIKNTSTAYQGYLNYKGEILKDNLKEKKEKFLEKHKGGVDKAKRFIRGAGNKAESFVFGKDKEVQVKTVDENGNEVIETRTKHKKGLLDRTDSLIFGGTVKDKYGNAKLDRNGNEKVKKGLIGNAESFLFGSKKTTVDEDGNEVVTQDKKGIFEKSKNLLVGDGENKKGLVGKITGNKLLGKISKFAIKKNDKFIEKYSKYAKKDEDNESESTAEVTNSVTPNPNGEGSDSSTTEMSDSETERQKKLDEATDEQIEKENEATEEAIKSEQETQDEINKQKEKAAEEEIKAEEESAKEQAKIEEEATEEQIESEKESTKEREDQEKKATLKEIAIEKATTLKTIMLEKIKTAARWALEKGGTVAGSVIKLIGSIGGGIMNAISGSKVLKIAVGVGLGAALIAAISKIGKTSLSAAASGKEIPTPEAKLPEVKASGADKEEKKEEEEEKKAKEKAEKKEKKNQEKKIATKVYVNEETGEVIDQETGKPIKRLMEETGEYSEQNLNVKSNPLDKKQLEKRIKNKEFVLVGNNKSKANATNSNSNSNDNKSSISGKINNIKSKVGDITSKAQGIASKTAKGASKLAKFAFMMSNPVLFASSKTIKNLKKLKDSPFGNLMSKEPSKASDILSNTGSTGAALSVSKNVSSSDLSSGKDGEGFWSKMFDDIFGISDEKKKKATSTNLADGTGSENASLRLNQSYISKGIHNALSKIAGNLGLATTKTTSDENSQKVEQDTNIYRSHGKKSTSEIYNEERSAVYVEASSNANISSDGEVGKDIIQYAAEVFKGLGEADPEFWYCNETITIKAGNETLDGVRRDCSGLMSAVIRHMGYKLKSGNTSDTTHVWDHSTENDIICDKDGKLSADWEVKKVDKDYKRQPGDILVTNKHTDMYVYTSGNGTYRGFNAGSGDNTRGPYQSKGGGMRESYELAVEYLETGEYNGKGRTTITDAMKPLVYIRYIGGSGGPISKTAAKGSAVKYYLDDMPGSAVSSHIWRNGGGWHGGTDISAPANTPIHVPVAGTVIRSSKSDGFSSSMGNYVIFKDKRGNTWRLMHMIKPPSVKTGDRIKPGQQVGLVGSTGDSTGNHLHIDIRKPGENWSYQKQGIMYDPEQFNLKKLSGRIPKANERNYYGTGKNNDKNNKNKYMVDGHDDSTLCGTGKHLYQRNFSMLPYNVNGDTINQTLGDSGCGPAAAAVVKDIYNKRKRYGGNKDTTESTKTNGSSAKASDTSALGNTASITDEFGKEYKVKITKDHIELFNVLIDCGCSDAAACGALGNWCVECGVDGMREWAEKHNSNPNLGGGIMQWSPYSKHEKWAKEHNFKDPWTWEANLAHIKDSIKNEGIWSRTKNQNPTLESLGYTECNSVEEWMSLNDPGDAAVNFERAYEGSGDWNGGNSEGIDYSDSPHVLHDNMRVQYAICMFEALGGSYNGNDSSAFTSGSKGLLKIKLDTYVDAQEAISKHVDNPGVFHKEEEPEKETISTATPTDEPITGDVSGELSSANPTETPNNEESKAESTSTDPLDNFIQSNKEKKPTTSNASSTNNPTTNNTINNIHNSGTVSNGNSTANSTPQTEEYTITSSSTGGLEKTIIKTNTGGTIVVCNNYDTTVKGNLDEIIDSFKHLNKTQSKALKILKAISELINEDNGNPDLRRNFILNDDGLDWILKGL